MWSILWARFREDAYSFCPHSIGQKLLRQPHLDARGYEKCTPRLGSAQGTILYCETGVWILGRPPSLQHCDSRASLILSV